MYRNTGKEEYGMNYGIGCYIRLSHADDAKCKSQAESNSVQNQRALIHHYLATHLEFAAGQVHEFVDDGYSGTTENLPEFQRMISMVHLNQLHCIIVKDFSRFARNYITMGNYLEQVFPLLGIRFISINDGYDSMAANNTFDNMSMTLKSILHSYYSRDLSAKIFSCNTQRMKNGSFVGTPCYGYVLSQDRTHFVIDSEAARIVRLIFDMALAGKSRPEIVKFLNDNQVPTPADYRQQHGYGKGNLITPNPLWDHAKVSKLLRQEAYTGVLIMRKHIQPVPCVKKYRKTAPEEQFIREGAHDAIISREEFDRVQEQMPKRKGWNRKNQRVYPLKGLVRCGTCGKTMCITNAPFSRGFQCKESLIEHSICSSQIHQMSVLEHVIHLKIQAFISLILRKEASCEQKQKSSKTIECQEQLQKLYHEQRQLLQVKTQCYEKYVSGALSLDAYMEQKKANSLLGRELQQLITKLEEHLIQNPSVTPSYELVQAAGIANQYCKSSELTQEMVSCFIDRILLFENRYVIQWRFQRLADELLIDDSSEETELKARNCSG